MLLVRNGKLTMWKSKSSRLSYSLVESLPPLSMMNVRKHKDCGYGYKVVCCYDDKYSKPVQIYRGENVVHKFMEKMLKEVEWWKIMKHKHFNKNMILTKVENKISRTLINVIFVIKNTLKKTFV